MLKSKWIVELGCLVMWFVVLLEGCGVCVCELDWVVFRLCCC